MRCCGFIVTIDNVAEDLPATVLFTRGLKAGALTFAVAILAQGGDQCLVGRTAADGGQVGGRLLAKGAHVCPVGVRAGLTGEALGLDAGAECGGPRAPTGARGALAGRRGHRGCPRERKG